MACSYYTFRNNDFYCEKRGEYVSSDHYYRYCRDYSYDECPIYKAESSSGGCYITSACIYALGCEDNCKELNIFRTFRDSYVKMQPGGIEDVDEYYDTAPKIVAKINALQYKATIYKEIFSLYLHPCLRMIEEGKLREAYDLYKTMFLVLKSQYLIVEQRNEGR